MWARILHEIRAAVSRPGDDLPAAVRRILAVDHDPLSAEMVELVLAGDLSGGFIAGFFTQGGH